ncbi:hypothetical protein JTE90_003100 [Oedothorax gibbosus]|uniref:Uncharacterized protein n=1 Tax=Oedothorax gibbosus TaxID=931172 RepID=A0AAV6VF43_9ARAC|nr:hypothetical protein JTE90_003100 [Oedothorax gibbosus]
MIEKSFSESITLQKGGPKSSTVFKSSYNVSSEKSYCTSVYFAPKLVPKRTFYTVNGDAVKTPTTFNRACSISNGEKTYESSVSMESFLTYDCDLPYYQNIELEPRLVPKEFSETVNNFPKSNLSSYSSSVLYDPSYTDKSYVVGLEVQKVREFDFSAEEESSGFTSSIHIVLDDSELKNNINGEPGLPLVNGV